MESIFFVFLLKMPMHMAEHCWMTSSVNKNKGFCSVENKEKWKATTLSKESWEDVRYTTDNINITFVVLYIHKLHFNIFIGDTETRTTTRQLTTQQMMKDKTTVTGDDLHVSTRAIYFANWHVNRIGGGQHGIVLNALRASPFRTSHMLGMRHMIHMCIPSLHVTLSCNSSDILWRDLLDLYHAQRQWCSKRVSWTCNCPQNQKRMYNSHLFQGWGWIWQHNLVCVQTSFLFNFHIMLSTAYHRWIVNIMNISHPTVFNIILTSKV